LPYITTQHHTASLGGVTKLLGVIIKGIATQFPREKLGLLILMLISNMRPLLAQQQGSSGTPFLQIAQAQQQAQREI